MRDILKPRKNFKPFEYDVVDRFAKPIWDAFWTVDHYKNEFSRDVQDFNVTLNDKEREVIKRSSLAIAQIEVKVKEFWSKIGDYFPKPEFKAVGYVYANNEVIHEMAYSQILEILGFNEEFEKIDEIPALIDRVDYLSKHANILNRNKAYKRARNFFRGLAGKGKEVDKDFIKSLVLFSIFIENTSLFSQFLIIKSFKKFKNCMVACNTVVTATSVEENLHGSFGMYLINCLREEYPDFFTPDIEEFILNQCQKAYLAETKVLDWIFELGDLDFLPRVYVDDFLKDRFNQGLEGIGIKGKFEVSEEEKSKTSWFYEGMGGGGRVDFFNSRPTTYSIGNSFSRDVIFAKQK